MKIHQHVDRLVAKQNQNGRYDGRRLRIAFLSTEYPSERFFAGGLASYLRRVTHALADLGHSVEAFVFGAQEQTSFDGPVRVELVSGRSRAQRWLGAAPGVWRWAEHAAFVGAAWNLHGAFLRRHRAEPFDLIQAASCQACGLVAAVRKVVPVVTRISSYEPLCRQAYQKPLDRLQRARERAELWQLRRSTRVYAPSRLLSEVLKREANLTAEVIEPPFFLPPVSADAPLPHPALSEENYGLYFGTIGTLKGCDRLVRVLPDLLRRNPDMRFAFAGIVRSNSEGVPFDSYIAQQLGQFGDRVLVLNEQPHERLLPLVARARLVVLPSRTDNLPNTCLEAMALDRAVIATRDASFEQLISDGANGFLVGQDDEPALRERIEQVWRMSPASRAEIGRKAAKSLERLDPKRATQALVDYFQSVIGSRHSSKH